MIKRVVYNTCMWVSFLHSDQMRFFVVYSSCENNVTYLGTLLL